MDYSKSKESVIPEENIQKWQNIVNILAEMLGVADALITRLDPPYLEVFQASQNPENPFEKGDRVRLADHFCEYVIKYQQVLEISDARQSKKWKNAPEVKSGRIAYLGFPLIWPDGDIFGTLCVHDVREKHFEEQTKILMKQFQELIESHLKIIYQKQQLKKEVKQKKEKQDKLKKNRNFLKGILESIQEGISVLNPDLTIRYTNSFIKDWYLENAPLEGEKCYRVYQNREQPCENCPSLRSLETGDMEQEIVPGLPGQGKWFEVFSYPLREEEAEGITGVVEFVRDITERKQKQEQLEEQKRKLNRANQDLTTYIEEITAMNEELEDSFEEINELNGRFDRMTKLISELVTAGKNEEEFLSDFLNTAVAILPEADCGSIYIYEEGYVRFVDCVGYDLSALQSLEIPASSFSNREQVIEVVGAEELAARHRQVMDEQSFNFLNENLNSIKEIINCDLTVNGKEKAGISVDIAADSDKSFSANSIRIFSAFHNIATTFFALEEYNKLQGRFTKELVTATTQIMEVYDEYTSGHSENVAQLAADIAEEMKLTEYEVKNAYWAGMVHDLGKLLIPLEILNKTKSLTSMEYDMVKRHPLWTYEALNKSESLSHIAKYALYHHERWDGQGYPYGLAGKDIPLISRILALADAWDAMRSERAYRSALSKEKALKEIKDNRGRQFGPEVTDIFLEQVVDINMTGSMNE